MNLSSLLAKHVRDVYFGGNWTWVNFKDTLADVDWQMATRQVYGLNTIATLVFHTNYFVEAIIKVLEGGPLDSKDSLSFAHPPIHSQDDWLQMLDKSWNEARHMADLVEKLPDSKLDEIFVLDKYGTYYRNLQGVVEHLHYHLGQIVVIKKVVQQVK